MPHSAEHIDVYLELGPKRVFAAALDWPGWCRLGRDESSALQALLDYGPRYARIVRSARLGFQQPDRVAVFNVVERVPGTATMDFGVPDKPPASDDAPITDAEVKRLQALLKACWRAFDATAEQAQGRTLRVGPRGGGRDLDKIVEHVLGAAQSYLTSLGGKASATDSSPAAVRHAILKTLESSAQGQIAPYGPRGGKRWSPRYFTRREAWHVLDHLWEIEDRLTEPGQ